MEPRAPRPRRYRVSTLVAGSLLASLVAFAPPASAGPWDSSASDPMERTVTAGLGSANLGGAWVPDVPRDFQVGGGRATITLPRGGDARTAHLPVSEQDLQVAASFALVRLPSTGNGITTGVTFRRTSSGDAYIARLRVAPDGSSHLGLVRRAANGVTTDLAQERALGRVKPGQWFRVETRTSGTSPVTLVARAWTLGASVPDWQVRATDASSSRLSRAGGVGLFTYSSSSTPGGSVLVDDFAAAAMGPLPPATTPTPVPTTPPTTPKPPTPTTPAPVSRPASSAGSTVGTARYPVPTGAVVVSPSGSDTAAGTAAAPLRTVARAVALAPSGATLVLRAGSYHESVVVPSTKRLTIQSWPGEKVWFDGSRTVSAWSASGSTWSTPWSLKFDTSPTYTRGASEANAPADWRFVDPAYPMAAHPEQVWIDDQPLTQVGSRAALRTGTFYLDRSAGQLLLGSDPRGRTVRVGALQQVLNVRSAGTVLRGFGVQRYSPSVPDMGALTIERPGVVLEDLVVLDSATTGIAVAATDATLRRVSIERSGMLGMTATYADSLVVDRLRSSGNNTERFHLAPVSGGLKVARTRGVTVTNSSFTGNRGPGFWADESTYDISVTSSDMVDNVGHGTSLELSAKALFADNLVSGNGGDGIKVNNTSDVRLFNNTFTGNGRSINLVQDPRLASNRSTPGHDPRQAFPDPTMTWLLGPVTVRNNVVAHPRSGNCLLCVEDYSRVRSAAQIGVSTDANAYSRATLSAPTWAFVWTRGPGNPQVFTDLPSFQAASGQERSSTLVTGTAVVDARGYPTSSFPGHARASALPSDVAARIGQASGTRHLGVFGR